MKTVQKPRRTFQPHPVLGWRLSPNSRVEVKFRPGVVQTIGPDGCRAGTGSDETVAQRLAIYGCSFTYGTGLTDAETYPSRLQSNLPGVRVLNKGIGGHGTLQNFLQFRQDVQDSAVHVAVFGIISDHRFRNIAHPQRMQQYLHQEWYELGIEHVPVARQGRDGRIVVDFVSIWQPSLFRKDFEAFLPNDHMIDQATMSVLDAILDLARKHAVPVLFALLDQLDPEFNLLVTGQFSQAVDVSLPHDRKHTFMPKDIHPNAYANQRFAEALLPHVRDLLAKSAQGEA